MSEPVTTQKEVVMKMLDSVNDRFVRYNELKARSATSVNQNEALQNTIINLKSKLANVKTMADTYDREYLDRMADKPLSGFTRSRGISTLQDWVLLLFFMMYAIISIGMALFVVISNGANAMFNGFMILTFSFSLGVMLTAAIVRFA